MRSILSILFTFFAALSLMAGGFDPYKVDPKFEKELAPLLSAIDSVGSAAYVAVLPTFKSLSAKYPKEWRAYYWEALANIRKAELDSTNEKDQILDEAERLINRAEMFIKRNPELYLLHGWVLKLRIDVDSTHRAAKYGADFTWYMDQCYKIDQGNPRYYYLNGVWSEKDTSEAGKKETYRYYRSAKLLFQDRPQGKYISEPDWGRGETDLAMGVFTPANFNFEDPTGEIAGAIADSLAKVAKENKGKESFKEEVVPKEMIGGILPESLQNEDAGTIEITDKGAKYTSKPEVKKKDSKDKKADGEKDKKSKKDGGAKDSKDKGVDGKSTISVGKDGEAAGTDDKDKKGSKSKDKKDKKAEEPKPDAKSDKKSKKQTAPQK